MWPIGVDQLERQLGLEGVPGHGLLLSEKIRAAQNYVEALLGYRIDDQFGGADQEPVPEVLVEAILQLAAWWFESREAGIIGESVATPPHSVPAIVNEYRMWTF